jgi:hypothetical protein
MCWRVEVTGCLRCAGGKRVNDALSVRRFEKVALYAENGKWRHAAKLLEDSRWSSKLCDLEDVSHGSPEDVCGPFNGELACIMRRAIRPKG